jgi:hypothetical protein
VLNGWLSKPSAFVWTGISVTAQGLPGVIRHEISPSFVAHSTQHMGIVFALTVQLIAKHRYFSVSVSFYTFVTRQQNWTSFYERFIKGLH